MDFDNPGEFNQAMMEFGALQCKPKNPACLKCPFKDNCVAYKNQKIDLFPVKKRNKKLKNRYLNYFVIQDKNQKIILEKRKEKDIWENLFQFPLIELPKLEYKKEELLFQIKSKYNFTVKFDKLELWNSAPLIHKLSHQKLYIYFWILNLNGYLQNGISVSDSKNFAMPIVIQNFIDNFYN